MRPEAPDPARLLDAARTLLLGTLLPALPPERHFAARMVANAIAIAARAAQQDPAWQAAAGERLARLLPGGDEAGLAAAIRAGTFDPGTPGHAEAAALLREVARARCAVSAPRALGGG